MPNIESRLAVLEARIEGLKDTIDKHDKLTMKQDYALQRIVKYLDKIDSEEYTLDMMWLRQTRQNTQRTWAKIRLTIMGAITVAVLGFIGHVLKLLATGKIQP